jgi:hypothetical protein
MPIANLTEARDALYTPFLQAWAASAYSTVPVHYPDAIEEGNDASESYVRVHITHTNERQKTLGETGQRRYRLYGLINFQVFTPLNTGQIDADLMTTIIKNAYRGKNTGSTDAITFRGTRVTEVGRDGGRLQTNVTVDFDYDEIA